MKRVAVIGAGGQLGSEIVKTFSPRRWQLVPLTHKQIEITDERNVRKTLGRLKPNMVINTAAFHNLDECERQPQMAFAVNAVGVGYLAHWCQDHDATLVHFSTDYVFGGDTRRRKPYHEADPVAPQSVYAVSKTAGEMFIQSTLKRYFLIRTCGLFGMAGSLVKGGNFVDKRIEQALRGETIYMVKDQTLSPTYAKNVAVNLEALLKLKHYGLYHMVSHGSCSWYEFTKTILQLAGLKTKLVPVTTKVVSGGPIRPSYSVLTNSSLQKLGLDRMRHWRENLKLYLQEKGY